MRAQAAAEPFRALVAAQLGRVPREPWSIAASCEHGFPTVIASPPVLEDGTRFPTMYWLTCPHLADAASRRESNGALSEWSTRLAGDPGLAAELAAADEELRSRRATLASEDDPCAAVGIAGQRELGHAKCLHAHIALYLVGIDDTIGREETLSAGTICADIRCADLHDAPEGALP